LKIED